MAIFQVQEYPSEGGNKVEVLSCNFKSAAKAALLDETLRAAMARVEGGFVDTRKKAVDALINFDQFRIFGQKIKDHTLAHLDYYLTQFEDNVIKHGGEMHWARNGEEANQIILDICERVDAKKITKGKSMVSEEAGSNQSLEKAGYQVIETDLGEYIIQLAGEHPSHIIAPAVHKTKQSITDLFERHHTGLGYPGRVTDREQIVDQARQILRDHFCSADVGITGANFLVAETGSVVLVTNEGNGDLTATLPKVHIVISSIEKVIPDLVSLGGFLRLLGRSATGQIMSVYTTLFNGPKRPDDLDGPDELHIILLDNGRSEILHSQFQEVLRCIRCGACMNHCPVYTSIGGHAYGWVYPGPIGSVLTPILVGQSNARDLPFACTLNGRCKTVCPVNIPLPDLIRTHRVNLSKEGRGGWIEKLGLQLWYFLARYPNLYGMSLRAIAKALSLIDNLDRTNTGGRFRWLPLTSPWTKTRDFPSPSNSTFQHLWNRQRADKS